MKLRFDRNALRLRVKKSDLETLREKNYIHETVSFPNGSFEYRLVISADEKEVTARMHGLSIEVLIPADAAILWMNNNETGIYHTINFGNNHSLDIIIEKDFPCKDRPEEDKSDTFIELAEKKQVNQC